ncbi:MAG: HAD family phosphatase [Acidimicrobiales bacterium]
MTTPPVEHVVFDLGGVVCRWLPDRRLAALAELSGLPAATIDQAVFESGFDDAGDRGRFSLDEFAATLGSLLGLAPSADLVGPLGDAWALAYEPHPAVLRAIRSIGRPVALLTNNGPLTEHVMGTALPEVGAAFDQLLFSWRLGAAKPEPEAFAAATAAMGTEPDRVLFFDDSEANVAGAQAFGWQAAQFHDHARPPSQGRPPPLRPGATEGPAGPLRSGRARPAVDQLRRSMIMAMPWPPPTHMVSRP